MLLYWLLAFVVFVVGPIYLAIDPDAYTPLLQILLSIFLFYLAQEIGKKKEMDAVRKAANDRWLPQAESVILRLLTLRSNVVRFSRSTKLSCGRDSCELPELEQNNMRAVRIKMKLECEANSTRLDDIARQLEDVMMDWRRFVEANCDGDECSRIFEAFESRQRALDEEELQTIEEEKIDTGIALGVSPPSDLCQNGE